MTSLIHKLGWRSVAAMTADGERYADYMASLQDILQHNNINFKINRKFPTNTEDLTPVIQFLEYYHNSIDNAVYG